jgi:hypothetical protein
VPRYSGIVVRHGAGQRVRHHTRELSGTSTSPQERSVWRGPMLAWPTVTLTRAHGGRRRFEDPKIRSCRPASAATRFARQAAAGRRRQRPLSGDRLAHLAPAGLVLVSSFDSSILRIFDVAVSACSSTLAVAEFSSRTRSLRHGLSLRLERLS